jgi:prepilin-type N-terminal cleavage/methylation domain-containing protein
MSPPRRSKARAHRHARRGYTVVELLMSLVVLAIGASGVIAMQKITLRSNSHAKNLAVATSIASAWADALAADASSWNSVNDLADTAWLQLANTAELAWVRPPYEPNLLRLGPGFDPLGNPVADGAPAAYCVDLRFAWLAGNPNGPVPARDNGLIRAEIRVFWRRDAAVTTTPLSGAFCTGGPTPAGLDDADADGYHFVYLTTAVAQTGSEG